MHLRVQQKRQADKAQYQRKKLCILPKQKSDYASNPSRKKEASRIAHAVNPFHKRAAAKEASKAHYDENRELIKAAARARSDIRSQ